MQHAKSAVRASLSFHKTELLTRLGVKLDAMATAGNVSEEDQASLTHEEFISVTRNRIDYEKLQALNVALRRLETGEYGACEECGEPIAPKRLKAIPWARFCIHCQELMSSRPPGENEVAPPEAVLAE